jgi:hypothetical protein
MNYKKSIFFVLFLLQLLLIQQIIGISLVKNNNLLRISPESSNTEGNDSWTKTWSILGTEWASSVAIDSSDNIYVLGGTRNAQTGLGNSFITKFNPMGDLIWEKLLDYNESHSPIYHTIEIDKDNNLFLVGNFENRNDWKDYIILSKFNNSGDLLWNKVLGGYDWFTSYDMAIDLLSNVYIVGSVEINPLNDLDTYIAKLNSSGHLLWNHTLGWLDIDEYFAVTTHADNKFYVAGTINDKTVILSYNSSGYQDWNYTLSLPYYYEQDITVDADGHILIADGVNLIKLNSTGITIWNYTLPEYSIFYTKVITDSSNDIYLAENRAIKCIDNSFFLESMCICTAIYLEKINSSGTLLWEKRCTECADVSCMDVEIDSTGNLYITGQFKGELGCFNPNHNALLMKNPKAFFGDCIEIYYDLIFLVPTPIFIIGIIFVIILIRKFIIARS